MFVCLFVYSFEILFRYNVYIHIQYTYMHMNSYVHTYIIGTYVDAQLCSVCP